MASLDGKVAIVTGASRGIGLAIAQHIVDDGGKVCITGRGQEALDQAVEALGGSAVAIASAGKADDPAHIEATVATTLETFGSVDLLVNNAGINPAFGPLMNLDLSAARKIFEVNVLGTLAWTQQVHRAWMGEHGGAIVNLSSVSGVGPAPGIAFYGASKAALISLTRDLAVELGPKVRVNAVAPAVVKTKFAEALYAGREEQVAAAYPLRRLGEPEDIGSVVAFLLSDEAGWVTGQTLVIDGGRTLAGTVD